MSSSSDDNISTIPLVLLSVKFVLYAGMLLVNWESVIGWLVLWLFSDWLDGC